MSRSKILTIAGFDPSGCAGFLADVKTAEQLHVYAMAVSTANTVQTDVAFVATNWTAEDVLFCQLHELTSRFDFAAVKIGLIKDFATLWKIVDTLRRYKPRMPIIWDPIMKASAGFEFHASFDLDDLADVCRSIRLITPNLPESMLLTGLSSPIKAAERLSQWTSVLLKGGHAENTANDVLFIDGQQIVISGVRFDANKRGTGCVLSSAITAHIANGCTIEQACRNAKQYIMHYITSGDGLLGYHA